MFNRFNIPTEIKRLLPYKGKTLRELSGNELTLVYEGLIRLRGDESKPRITVAIPAYNEETILYATLRSISMQKGISGVEVLVVDNNSSDRTAELAWKCGARVIKETKQGVAHARQFALHQAQGEVLVSCDADTLYPSTWLAELVKPLARNKSVSTTYSLHCQIDETQKYGFQFHAYQYAKHLFYYMRAPKRGQLNCGGASMAFRKTQALAFGYNTNLTRGEDGFLALQLSSKGNIKMAPSKRAFIYTSNRRTLLDGSLNQAFVKRALKGLRNSLSFLTTQKIPTS